MENILIPKKIKAGFQHRQGTYTGKLAYVIAFDGKKWRKEKSWEGWITKYVDAEKFYSMVLKDYERRKSEWFLKQYPEFENYYQECLEKGIYFSNRERYSCDESIKPIEYENKPIEGFVLNKKVGGYDTGWNHRQTYCRVYDPRGFEVEIGLENLLYILEHSDSIKGKGLTGKFCYGWDGPNLVLIPESSPDFVAMEEYTDNIHKKLGVRDLVPGNIYKTRKNYSYVYMGKFDWFEWEYDREAKQYVWDSKPEHVFYNIMFDRFEIMKPTAFAVNTNEKHELFGELLDRWWASQNAYDFDRIETNVKETITFADCSSNRKYWTYGKVFGLENCYIYFNVYWRSLYNYEIYQVKNGKLAKWGDSFRSNQFHVYKDVAFESLDVKFLTKNNSQI